MSPRENEYDESIPEHGGMPTRMSHVFSLLQSDRQTHGIDDCWKQPIVIRAVHPFQDASYLLLEEIFGPSIRDDGPNVWD